MSVVAGYIEECLGIGVIPTLQNTAVVADAARVFGEVNEDVRAVWESTLRAHASPGVFDLASKLAGKGKEFSGMVVRMLAQTTNVSALRSAGSGSMECVCLGWRELATITALTSAVRTRADALIAAAVILEE